MHLSLCGATPKTQSCRLDLEFGGHFLDLCLPRWNQYQWQGDISVHPPEWGKCLFCQPLVSRPDTMLVWAKVQCWGGKLEQSIITQLQPRFMHRDCYPLLWQQAAAFFFFFLSFCYFFRWNLRRELQNTKQLWLWLPLWVLFPPPVVTGSWGKAKAVRSLQKKREISAGRVCTSRLICCEVWVPCSCWCDLLM